MKDLKEAFPDCVDSESHNLSDVLFDIVSKGNEKFVFVIDEWDALFREYKDDHKLQKDYILFLRTLFKNQDTTEATIAAYITGVLYIFVSAICLHLISFVLSCPLSMVCPD